MRQVQNASISSLIVSLVEQISGGALRVQLPQLLAEQDVFEARLDLLFLRFDVEMPFGSEPFLNVSQFVHETLLVIVEDGDLIFRVLLEVLLEEVQVARGCHGVSRRRVPLHLLNLAGPLVDLLLDNLAPAAHANEAVLFVFRLGVHVLGNLKILLENAL